jgi:hypothetical protein
MNSKYHKYGKPAKISLDLLKATFEILTEKKGR